MIDDETDANYWRPNGCGQWVLLLAALALAAAARAASDFIQSFRRRGRS